MVPPSRGSVAQLLAQEHDPANRRPERPTVAPSGRGACPPASGTTPPAVRSPPTAAAPSGRGWGPASKAVAEGVGLEKMGHILFYLNNKHLVSILKMVKIIVGI